MIRVAIADDQGLVRDGLRMMLTAEADLEVVGEAATGAEAVDLVLAIHPDVVLMDIRMPDLDGIAATRRITALACPTRVLVLTTFNLDEYVYLALRAGAAGFLLKDARSHEVAAAVRTVHRGDAILAPPLTRRLIEEYCRMPRPAERPGTPTLTGREVDVVRLLGRGLSNAEIAARLFLSEATVKTHVARILAKLGLRDRLQVVVHAYETGLIRPGHGAPT